MASSDVVIVSQFGAKAGGTPGNYIRRYTSRLDATEELAPYTIAQTLQAYRKAYDERNETAEQMIDRLETEDRLIKEDQKLTDQSARLFGNGGLVYSRERFSEAIRTTERALEEGHTLITPVISFSHDYLKRRGIIPEDMPKVENDSDEGAYRGKVDQLKLRRAVTNGMNQMCDKAYFVEPEWTAAIQVDTANVHVHVTLIETCDSEKVPKERFVQSPRQELRLTQEADGNFEKEFVPVLGEDGKPLKENLGERGKLQPRATRAFREGMEQELIRMQASKPFTNDLSAHSQLVKQHVTHLSLEHTALSSQLVQIYEALPKGGSNASMAYIEQDQKLRSDQRNWRYGSNRQSMKKPNRLAKAYVERVLDEHRDSIGYATYEQAVDNYVETKAPDYAQMDNTIERERLKEVVIGRLKEELVNGLYKSLKPLRVVDDKEAFVEAAESSMDERERVVVEGQLTPKGLQLALLDDEQLKDLIADSVHDEDPGVAAGALSMEKRLRDYPKRYSAATEKRDYYGRLKEGYDRLADKGRTTNESLPMRELYETEEAYFQAVKDKYAYLMDQRQRPYLSHKGQKFPLMDAEVEDWLEQIHPIVTETVDEVPKIPTTEHTMTDVAAPARLPEPVVEVLQQEAGETPLTEAVKHNARIRRMTRLYDELVHQQQERDQYVGVSKERFDEVKGYDLIETIYDFDPQSSRVIAEPVVSAYRSALTARKETFTRALDYLEMTRQNTPEYPEFDYYHQEATGVDQALQFADVVERSGQLPKPLRRHHQTAEEIEKLSGARVLPPVKAKELSVDFLSVSHQIVQQEAEEVKDYTSSIGIDETFDIQQELIRLNQRHIARLKREAEEEEATRRMEAEELLVRAVPEREVKVTEGELDKQYARNLFKEHERTLIPRYVSTYYEMSYAEPSID